MNVRGVGKKKGIISTEKKKNNFVGVKRRMGNKIQGKEPI